MGPTEVVPQRLPQLPSRRARNEAAATDGGEQAAAAAAAAAASPLPVPLRRGSLLVYDSRLTHRGGANTSPHVRGHTYEFTLLGEGPPPAGLPYTIEPDEAACFALGPDGLRHAPWVSGKKRAPARCNA
jgi:hypothetical protein